MPTSSVGLFMMVARNLAMGLDSELPWSMPKNLLDYFINITKGKVVVQGSNTFITHGPIINNDCKNVVLSRNCKKVPDEYDLCIAGENYYSVINQIKEVYPDQDIIFIGGVTTFHLAIQACQDIHLARIDGDFPGTVIAEEAVIDKILHGLPVEREINFLESTTFPSINITHYKRSLH
jgi:dihydrofolate reductase